MTANTDQHGLTEAKIKARKGSNKTSGVVGKAPPQAQGRDKAKGGEDASFGQGGQGR